MTEDELQKIIPEYGNRLRVKAFCKQKRNNEINEPKKHWLLAKLTKKFFDEQQTTSKRKKYNSEKGTRQIELGWKNWEYLGGIYKYINVNQKKRGGPRKISAEKTWKKTEILKKAVELYFPGGKSTKGAQTEFEYDLVNPALEPLPDDLSVQALFEQACLKFLKVYFITKKKYSKSSCLG